MPKEIHSQNDLKCKDNSLMFIYVLTTNNS
uniref:Uncharacterized protein n=1 Tax=Rhizophora mucronata TaxID=61149 RepID=A0A2P2R2J4_RHIMU